MSEVPAEPLLAVAGVGLRFGALIALEDVSFYYKDKTATLPPNEYTGILALKMPPQGIDVDIKIRLLPTVKEREAKRAYHQIELLTVQIADNVEVDVRDSNHAIMLALFKPIFNMRFRDALGRSLGEQLRVGLDWLDGVAWDVGQRSTVFTDAGLGSGAALAAAVWSEIGRLTRERSSGWRVTGTGIVLEQGPAGGAKFAIGAEPHILSGEKRGPMGTGSESLGKRVGAAVQELQGQTGTPEDAKNAIKQEAMDVKKHVQGLVGEGKRQVRSFQRSVEDKSAKERQSSGWKSDAFDI